MSFNFPPNFWITVFVIGLSVNCTFDVKYPNVGSFWPFVIYVLTGLLSDYWLTRAIWINQLLSWLELKFTLKHYCTLSVKYFTLKPMSWLDKAKWGRPCYKITLWRWYDKNMPRMSWCKVWLFVVSVSWSLSVCFTNLVCMKHPHLRIAEQILKACFSAFWKLDRGYFCI